MSLDLREPPVFHSRRRPVQWVTRREIEYPRGEALVGEEGPWFANFVC